jgi:hypothetical protein
LQGSIKRKKKVESDLATREKDKFETIYILEPHEIASQRLKLASGELRPAPPRPARPFLPSNVLIL